MNLHECQVCGRHIYEKSNKIQIRIEGQDLGYGHKRCVQYIDTLLDRKDFFVGCMHRAANLARYYQDLLSRAPSEELLEDIKEQLKMIGVEYV